MKNALLSFYIIRLCDTSWYLNLLLNEGMHILKLKVHLTPNCFFAIIIRLILWSNFVKKILDLVKSSNFYAPSKLSFQWFATVHGESGENVSCDIKSRTNALAVPVRSSIFYECSGDFAAQVFR